MSSEKHFYQNQKITTVKTGKRNCSIFRGIQIALAERQSDSAEYCNLLTVDIKGSVTAVKGISSPELHSYSPYGNAATIPSSRSLLGFNGERAERTGLYLLGSYRAYSAILMRFLSPDILSPFDKGWINPYAYCAGDPINYTDPTGHMMRKNRTPAQNVSHYERKLGKLNDRAQGKTNYIQNLEALQHKAPEYIKNRHTVYKATGHKAFRTYLDDMADDIHKANSELSLIVEKAERTTEKLKSALELLAAEKASLAPTAPRGSIISNYDPSAPRASIISNYDPSAPRASIISNYDPSAPRASIISNHAPSASSLSSLMEGVRRHQSANPNN
ncbi:RHS repeat-associated core domain-containing protein [Pseudomonas sp. LM20]|uniref:RHS repeat-associated core domain-containing protein n=1 Tax=Pseudomonas sp. LM20 TaxID=2899116 RepID=UPI001F48ED37|nr:RHS repeat-associated core domain-containing protein [Pseudomonas sp. LM20]MCE5989303.1 RHS repeat-associated core domain-containing protein [Pseudomonas sp. LM20]